MSQNKRAISMNLINGSGNSNEDTLIVKFAPSDKKITIDQPQEKECSSKQGLHDGWTRATIIVKESHMDMIRAIAYWDRLTVKDLMEKIFDDYLKSKNIKAIPK